MKTNILFPSALCSLALISGVSAWGDLGHETIAYIAQNFVSSSTKSFCQGILSDTSTSYLANVATWADTFKYTSAGEYSQPFHFIDAQDNPPSSCGVNYDRDCGAGGCVVLAISNYTQRLGDGRLSQAHLDEALKYLVHFLGDIHQPLHDENLDYGGNDIDVTFAGTTTNLHHIWDTNMPEKYAGGYSLSDAQTWATSLTTSIKSGTYASQRESWLNGMDISDAITSSMLWATDANAYVCSTVMPNGVSAVEDTDLSGSYYEDALPVIELLFAQAGYRLAAWLNLIVTGSTGL
ncbi:nuclease S1 [Xylona heveae TC161]|uniref:Nuclease S1 n=1 Tax=Xylona heveae (strain CBS 132557 / TC161) TaxID=1328760 RepID=A0A165I6G1_XYLHT|nr:nuclease S1 [Xylona heveae TC161]KZF24453.1 nuclease S1 [Xylona heveae TC161]